MSLSVADAMSFLRARPGGAVDSVAPIGHGDWSQAFSFTRDGQSLIARFGKHVADFEKDRYASRFAAPKLPIPRVLEIGETPTGYFCVSERAYGAHLDTLDADAMAQAVPAVCRMLLALHDIDPGETSGYGGFNGRGDAPASSWAKSLLSVDTENDRVHGWHAAMESSPTGIGPYKDALAFLAAHVDRLPTARHVIHNDLLHYNVLVDTERDRIAAVVDWGNALYGDFLYDVAAFIFYAPWYPAMNGIDWAAEYQHATDQRGILLPDFDARVRCYFAHIGCDGMAYSAFTKRWDSLAEVAERTLCLIGQR